MNAHLEGMNVTIVSIKNRQKDVLREKIRHKELRVLILWNDINITSWAPAGGGKGGKFPPPKPKKLL